MLLQSASSEFNKQSPEFPSPEFPANGKGSRFVGFISFRIHNSSLHKSMTKIVFTIKFSQKEGYNGRYWASKSSFGVFL